MSEVIDEKTKQTLKKIPLLTINAGPRDGKQWENRLKEEYSALIAYVKMNKENDQTWFNIQSNKEGTKWFGTCWFIYDMIKYEFKLQFDIPITYPATAPEIEIPELEGKTIKMYRGGKICQTIHFKPLWSRNVPHFGIAHALALSLAPWLATEIPEMVNKGLLQKK